MIRVLKRDPSAMVCLLLVVLTWGIYAQVANFEFVQYDDDRHVFEHPVIREGLSWESVGWAFTSVVWANWTPLAWLSHMLDVEMFGLDAGGHHVTNALLHVLNTLLLFWVLRSLTGAVWRSGFVAALFAVHPLHVESVAWISERRDVLSTAFGLLSLWAYAHWTRSGRWLAYAMSFACLGLGLMSKPMLVTLPLLFLLVDYWPLQRLRFGRALERGDRADSGTANRLSTGALVIEKLPLFALVASISLVTFLSQSGGGSVVTVLPLGDRVANALVSYVLYLAKTIWPTHLAVFYPHPNLPGGPEPWSALEAVSAALFLIVVSVLLFRFRRWRYLLVGWIWFLIGLAPVIGLIQIGEQAMADRYTYLPLIGIFVAVSWGAADLVASRRARRAWLAPLAAAAGVFVIATFAAVSWQQIGYWRDTVALFTHSIESTEGNFLLHFNLANVYKGRGQIKQALHHYEEAVAIHPQMGRAHFNLANTLRSEGRLDEAIEHYWQAARYWNNPNGRKALASAVFERDGTYDVLVAFLREAAERNPHSAEAYNQVGHALRLNGELEASIEAYRRALELLPEDESIRRNLAGALAARQAESQQSDHRDQTQ